MNDGFCDREKIGPHAFSREETMVRQRNDVMRDHRVHGKRHNRIIPGKRLWLKGLLSALLIGGLASTGFAASRTDDPTIFRGALLEGDGVGTPGEQVILWQNWDDDKRQKFWFTPQGSQIIPYDWFLALELPNSEDLFHEKENMDRLRYIPQDKTELNPEKLPIGFTKDLVWYSNESIPGGDLESLKVTYKDYGNPIYQAISKNWLGLTCAACHTNQIEFNGKKIVIDGAPAMGDFEGLMKGLVESMEATLRDEDKFQRFATKVLDMGNGEAKSNVDLREHLEKIIEIRKAGNTRNSGDGLEYGFGRLDAINSILNEVSSAALGIKENRRPANAPVSYPFIWDAPHHDYIQWNGMVANDAAGALGRNVGEVLGVFGTLKFKPSYFPVDPEELFERRTNLSLPPPGYESSVRIPNLGKLEHLLVDLWSPLWPGSVLPPLKEELIKAGEKTFKKQCADCHGIIDVEDERRRITSTAVPVGVTETDDAMAKIFFERMAKTGPVQGQYERFFPMKEDEFDRHARKFEIEEAVAATILGHAVRGTLARDRVGTKTVIENTILSGFRTVSDDDQPKTASYKARPLNGIWATAPYLHNGSVPTLMQLLKPKRREEVFYVGSREFVPDEVGFKYEKKDYKAEDPQFLFNTLLQGNHNTGHTYYGGYFEKNEEAFRALMEYLKSL